MVTPMVDAVEMPLQSLDSLFSESVDRYPDRPALFVAGRHWSYRELDAQCSAIKRTLRAAGLSGKGRKIGLIYARAMFSYAAILAIMQAGCVYVPFNPMAPAERLVRIVSDAGIEGVIVDATDDLSEEVADALRRSGHLWIITNTGDSGSLRSLLKGSTSECNVLTVLQDSATLEQDQDVADCTSVTQPRLAYIIYTSGSTGEPKGVAIAHVSACRCMEKLCRLFEANEQDRFTQFSALSFDYSLVELFVCWKAGGSLYVPAAHEAMVPLSFAVTHEITVWFSVPSLAGFLVKLGLLKNNILPSVRLSLFGGEALPFELAQAWAAAAPSSRLLNLYGPTEVTIVSTYYEYEMQAHLRTGTVPIGVALPGLRAMVVDNGAAVEMDDAPGELWLSGDQLAVGYWNSPCATEAAFVRFPPADDSEAIWYRTGDLVSFRSGVGLQFRGRLDRQIKLRGFRVELQEIESVLRDVIGAALVAVIPVRNTGGICEKLVAYCDEQSLDEAAIKTRCLNRLPSYMVPERIFHLESLPLNDHGKIDYRTLTTQASAWSGQCV
jgi:D-alanine--poly(phosphoribitol) ligase subunit 1